MAPYDFLAPWGNLEPSILNSLVHFFLYFPQSFHLWFLAGEKNREVKIQAGVLGESLGGVK